MSDDFYSVRPFSSGSRKAPDVLDHYLEAEGYYRKHTARDASSLFRVISEQIFGVQMYHGKVRQDCALFMQAHEKEYSNLVDTHYYYYISNLKKGRTAGTLLELRVLARMYKKNVTLFEPKTKGAPYVTNDDYDNTNPFFVFFSEKDKHFDSIFTLDYVKNLANCQAVTYEILYAGVFKLPDIEFATERMLHDQYQNNPAALPENSNKYQTATGKICEFDSHLKTKCVLKNPKTCHFHNRTNFEEVVGETIDTVTTLYDPNDPSKVRYYKPIEGFLHDKVRSCVRQLLDEGITPYPYKVAKALDVNIYRNTEFEQWSEKRREQRLKWLEENELPMKLLSDEKCSFFSEEVKTEQKDIFMKDLRTFHDLDSILKLHVSTDAEFRKKHKDSYESKTNFNFKVSDIELKNKYYTLDDDLRKNYKSYDNGHHFNDSYKLGSLFGYDHLCPKTQYETIVMPATVHRGGYEGRRGRGDHHNATNVYKQQGNYEMDKVGYAPIEQQQHQQQQQQHEPQYSVPQVQGYLEPQYTYEQVGNEIPQAQPQYYTTAPWNESFNSTGYYHTQNMPAPQQLTQQYVNYGHPQTFINPQNQRYTYVAPMANISVPPPPIYPINNGYATDPLIRPIDLNSTIINYGAKNSYDINGKDLPLNEIATLQFFFNLGIDYFNSSGIRMNTYNVPNQQFAQNIQENKEGGAAAAAVAMATATGAGNANDKPNNDGRNGDIGSASAQQNGNNIGYGRNNHNGNKRRPHNPNNYRVFNSNPKRTDVKFNSNVKNLHKNEHIINKMQQKNSNESVVAGVNAAAPMTPRTITKPVNGTPIYTKMPPNVMEQQPLQYETGPPIEMQQNLYCPPVSYPMYYEGTEYMPQQPIMHFPYVYSIPQHAPQQQHIQGTQLEHVQPLLEGTNISNDSGLVIDNQKYQPQQYYYSPYQNQPYPNAQIPIFYQQQAPHAHAVLPNDTPYLQVQTNTMEVPNVATMMSNMTINPTTTTTNQNTNP